MVHDEMLYGMLEDIQKRVRSIELDLVEIKQQIKYRALVIGILSGFLPAASVVIYFVFRT